MPVYKYSRPNNTDDIIVINDDGTRSYTSIRNDIVDDFIKKGGVIQAADALPIRYSEYETINPVRLVTSDATLTELVRYTVPLQSIVIAKLELEIINMTVAGIPTKYYEATLQWKRINAGAIFVGVTAPDTIVETGMSAPAPSASAQGNDAVISVTGINGNNLHWHLTGRYRIITNNGKQ